MDRYPKNSNKTSMTAEQFAALVQLLRIRTGGAQEAAHLVLVSGHPVGEAAALAGVSSNSASNAVARMRRGLELARAAAADWA